MKRLLTSKVCFEPLRKQRGALMRNLFLLIGVTVFLAGCVMGRINTVTYAKPPDNPSFIVISPNPASLTDRNIAALIETKMQAQEFHKAASVSDANVAVLFNYRVGAQISEVSGYVQQDSSYVGSDTSYPRYFQIIVVNLTTSKLPEKMEIIWQGEIKSKGNLDDISRLAPDFVDALFEYYGSTVTNQRFAK
jgi:hypothetical protein